MNMNAQMPAFFKFGPFVVDLKRRALLRGASPVHLSPRSFDLLAYLVQQDGRVVTREDLEERVWGGASVKDANIGKHIQLVRQAIGDIVKPHVYLRTVQCRGFQFNGASPMENAQGSLLRETIDVSRSAAVELLSIALHFQKIGTSASLSSATACLHQAHALQTGMPEVSANLAWLHLLKAIHGFAGAESALEEARKWSAEALEADPMAAGARLLQAAMKLFAERDASGAAALLNAAADGSDVRWFVLHVLALTAAEQHGEAIARARAMSVRFPASPSAAHAHALAHYYAGTVDDAHALAKRLLAFRPECGSARLVVAYCDAARGRFEEARRHLTDLLMPRASYAADVERFRRPALAALAYIHGAEGDVEAGRALQTDLRASGVPSYCALAIAAMGTNDDSLVFDHLKRAYEAREPWSLFLALDPLYKAWFAARRQRAS